MKSLITYLFCFSLLAAASGCFRNNIRVEEFNVPKMQSQECLTYLSTKLKAVEGVNDVQADFNTQTVTVTFTGLKLGYKNIEFVIAGSGFDCNETPAPAAAKAALPIPCQ